MKMPVAALLVAVACLPFVLPATASVPPRPPPPLTDYCIGHTSVGAPLLFVGVPAGATLVSGKLTAKEWRPLSWEIETACAPLAQLLRCLRAPSACVSHGPDPELQYWDGMEAFYDGNAIVQIAIAGSSYGPVENYSMTADEYLDWYYPA